MRSRALWMLLVALLMAGGAAWMAHRWLQSQPGMPEETEPVVVAAVKISFAQKIESDHIKIVKWPRGSVPAGVYKDTDLDKVVGKVANQTILVNEPVLHDRIVESQSGGMLAASVDPGKRALSVRVNEVTGVAGLIMPGNQVDIIESIKDKGSSILLENIKVLAIDQETSPEKNKPAVVKAVTLELTPGQVETLVEATQEGSIHLALRNPASDNSHRIEKKPPPRPATVTPPAVMPPPPQKTEQQHRTLTVVRGDKVSIYEIR